MRHHPNSPRIGASVQSSGKRSPEQAPKFPLVPQICRAVYGHKKVRLLLDTHIALWAIIYDKRLAGAARCLIADQRNLVYVSVASIWEIAIKHGLSRGTQNHMSVLGDQVLAIEAEHAVMVEQLPAHHKDPFDRMIVAQALCEPLHLLTHDHLLGRYSDSIMVV